MSKSKVTGVFVVVLVAFFLTSRSGSGGRCSDLSNGASRSTIGSDAPLQGVVRARSL